MTKTDHLTTFEIGSIYGITPQSLRFYEDQGLLYPLIEDGTRFYTAKDRIKLELIIKGKRLGFSFSELRLLILQPIEQRALHDLVPLSSPPITNSVTEEEMIEEIWQAERKIEQLRERVSKLQMLLARKRPPSS